MTDETCAAKNTDRELYREPTDRIGAEFYQPCLHVTEGGAIGINVGGMVFVKPLREWHGLATAAAAPPRLIADVSKLAPDQLAELRKPGAAMLVKHAPDASECERHIKTAIGCLDDPTGPLVVEDVRAARDALLLALAALKPPLSVLSSANAPREDGGAG
jgi:hypothetical protein